MMSVHIADGDERLRGAALVGFGVQHDYAAVKYHDAIAEEITVTYRSLTKTNVIITPRS